MDAQDTLQDPTAILRHPALDVAPFAERVTLLAAHSGLDLAATLFALNHLPLAVSRPRHPEVRRNIASLIADQTPALRPALPALVIDRLAALTRPGTVDAIDAIVAPLVSDTISLLSGIVVAPDEASEVSRIFSQKAGPARRLRIEAELRDLIARIEAGFPLATPEEVGLRLSLVILGRDALMGLLGTSLHAVISSAADRPLSEATFPELPPCTGVPYIDRVAQEPCTVEGTTLRAGDSIRARLDSLEAASDPARRLGFFGAGAHLCLGRSISLDLWREIGRCFGTIDARARVADYALRKDDVFAFPARFVLEIET